MQDVPFYIHDHVSPRPPKFVRTPKPTFRTTHEKHKYWDREFKRWIDGYGGLTGYHYFYLQEGWIQDNYGKPIRPRWRECDDITFEKIKYAWGNYWDAGVLKRREYGLTSIGAGLFPFYFIQTSPGCHTGMTSCDLDRIAKMFTEKTITMWQNFDKDISLPEFKKNQTKQNSQLIVKQKIEIDGEYKIVYPDVFCTETVKNPSAFSVARMLYVFLDEFPLHENRDNLLNSLYPTLEKGMVRTGNLLWGGTVEDGISAESLNALRTIVDAGETDSKTAIIFIPAGMGMTEYIDDNNIKHNIPGTENGWDNIPFATEIVLKERERLERAGMHDKLRARIKNYPLSLEEILESMGTGKLPESIMTKVEIRSREIRKKDESVVPTFRYELEYGPNGSIEARQHNKGTYFITSMPDRHLQGTMKLPYIAANDPIPYGDADIDDGSDDCMVIKNRATQKYVAIWLERNMDADYTFNKKKMLQDFYFQAPSMLEMNRGEVVYTKYKEAGSLHLLAKKPVNLGIKYETSRRYGWYKNKTGARANAYLIKFLENHIGRQDFIEIMKQLEVFLVENTDIVDAMIGCELFDEDLRMGALKEHKKTEMPRTQRVLTRDPKTGKIFYELKSVRYK